MASSNMSFWYFVLHNFKFSLELYLELPNSFYIIQHESAKTGQSYKTETKKMKIL
jgi:hypothetical protein